MGVIAEIIKSYDSALNVCEASAIHHDISFKNYIKKILDQLMECDVFNPTKSSRHKSFKFHSNLINSLEEQKRKSEWNNFLESSSYC